MSSKVIIFDFDGTIADSFDFVTGYLVAQAGKQPLSLAERKKLFEGLSIRTMAEKLHIGLFKKIWMFFHGRREMTNHISEIKPFPGMESVIKHLHAQGHKLFAVSSNRNKNIQLFLRQHGLNEYFAGTLGSASVIGKTMALRLLLWHRDIKAANCIYIGDETGDMHAANRLRIRTIAVAWGFNDIKVLNAEKPSAVAHTPADILNILGTDK